jgi:uncharacterized protein with HEPN domain
MNRDKTLLERIKTEVDFIRSATADKTESLFLADDVLQHAVCMSLITIGECAHHLSDGFREKHSEIEWIQIIAVRNIAAHGYWQLDMRQIWAAVKSDIPMLKDFIDAVLQIKPH